MITECKAISLHQPWASLIAWGHKKFETRSWKTNYRGDLVIYAAKRKQREQELLFSKILCDLSFYGVFVLPHQQDFSILPFGMAIVKCQLTDCIMMTPEFIAQQSDTEKLCGDWKEGRYAWRLEDVQVFSKPFEVKGYQGLWNISY